ncbi:MAG TPA: carboxylating nicotinate-nucleotide diphosphorylase [Dehalococcoidia bacterium]|nr:carboxylating nicotinate-nucleotide diphosphorylase [Dehalococcoidia bacterium]
MGNLKPIEEQIKNIIDLALLEDTSAGDTTSRILIPGDLDGEASITPKENGILAGGDVARLVFLRVEPSLKVELLIPDGKKLKAGDKVITTSGNLAAILKAERTALNLLGRLSGIATETAKYVVRAKGTPAVITDTRKTAPGMRLLDKYAVRIGGGKNHRFHLGDGIIIKDNHIAALRTQGMSLADIITMARVNAPEGLKIEIEVNTIEDAMEAADAGADIVMLDNMPPELMKRVVEQMPAKVKTEASGSITLDDVRRVAMMGVDTISIGAITHSAKTLDFSLRLETKA